MINNKINLNKINEIPFFAGGRMGNLNLQQFSNEYSQGHRHNVCKQKLRVS